MSSANVILSADLNLKVTKSLLHWTMCNKTLKRGKWLTKVKQKGAKGTGIGMLVDLEAQLQLNLESQGLNWIDSICTYRHVSRSLGEEQRVWHSWALQYSRHTGTLSDLQQTGRGITSSFRFGGCFSWHMRDRIQQHESEGSDTKENMAPVRKSRYCCMWKNIESRESVKKKNLKGQ